MSCPYFDEGYFGACGASESRYVPSMDKREQYCFKQSYRCCPTLLEHLYEEGIAVANRSPHKKLSQQ